MGCEPMIHLYSQAFEHDDAWIVGDFESLAALRDKIDSVLNGDPPKNLNVFASDGEGYTLRVKLIGDCPNLRLPYTDELSQDKRTDAVEYCDAK